MAGRRYCAASAMTCARSRMKKVWPATTSACGRCAARPGRPLRSRRRAPRPRAAPAARLRRPCVFPAVAAAAWHRRRRHQEGHAPRLRHGGLQQLEPFAGQRAVRGDEHAGDVAARPRQAGHHAEGHRIEVAEQHHRQRGRGLLHRAHRRCRDGDDELHACLLQLARQLGQPGRVAAGPAAFRSAGCGPRQNRARPAHVAAR